MEATFDGAAYHLEPGDVAWAGVGCVHGFRNVGDGPRALAGDPGAAAARRGTRYRFARDWDYLRTTTREETT